MCSESDVEGISKGMVIKGRKRKVLDSSVRVGAQWQGITVGGSFSVVKEIQLMVLRS